MTATGPNPGRMDGDGSSLCRGVRLAAAALLLAGFAGPGSLRAQRVEDRAAPRADERDTAAEGGHDDHDEAESEEPAAHVDEELLLPQPEHPGRGLQRRRRCDAGITSAANITNFRFFANDFETRTEGVDLVVTWRPPQAGGHTTLDLALNVIPVARRRSARARRSQRPGRDWRGQSDADAAGQPAQHPRALRRQRRVLLLQAAVPHRSRHRLANAGDRVRSARSGLYRRRRATPAGHRAAARSGASSRS